MASVADIGIDLGTSNVVIYARNRGVVLDEPAVVALERDSRVIRAIGMEAYRMIGRTPSGIVAMRPLKEGSVADFELTSSILHHFVVQVIGKRMFSRPRAVLSLPSGINENEKRNISAVMFEAGVRRTQLLDRPVAAAIGADMNINEVYGSMVVDIGAGMTDIAVLSLGAPVISDSLKVAGVAFNEMISRSIRRNHSLFIGNEQVESVKIRIGTCFKRPKSEQMQVSGRNVMTGLPKTVSVTSEEIREALHDSTAQIADAVHGVLEKTPPELAADITTRGIVFTGGGSLLSGLTELIEERTGINVMVAENPADCVAIGAGKYVEMMDRLGRIDYM